MGLRFVLSLDLSVGNGHVGEYVSSEIFFRFSVGIYLSLVNNYIAGYGALY